MPTPDQQSRWLEPGVLVTLYELDLSGKFSAFTGSPGPILYFHGHAAASGSNNLLFRSHTYGPYPIKAEGFEWNTRGTLPRPTLSVSNIGSVVSALCREYEDLVGATVIQRHTFENFLDDRPDHGPPYKEFPAQIFAVERKASETNTLCTFELATAMDAEGVTLPRRQVLATACPWTYRGVECGYAAPVAGGSGWPVMNRLGQHFGEAFDDGLVSPDGTQLASDDANFRTDPAHLSDVGKVVSGANFVPGTMVAAVVSESVVNLSANATPGSPVHFNINRTTGRSPGGATGMPQPWSATTVYSENDTAYVMVKGVRVYAVSKKPTNVGHPIYDENFWMLDVCLKKLSDCEYHFGHGNPLPYGGMPGAAKLQ